jgi:LysM repeat protein
MHTESPSASAPPLTVSQPDLAVPGTAPFVSASGELIKPPIPALAVSSPAPTPAPLEIAALPTPLETAPIIAALVVAAPSPLRTPEAIISSAIAPDALIAETTQPAAAPLEIARLEIPVAVTPAASELTPVVPSEAAEEPLTPTPAPLEIAMLETPAPEPSAIPPAEVTPAEVSLAPAPAADTMPAEVAPPAASELKLAMLPPTPVEPRPAPRVAAEPAPSPVIYTVRERGSLTRLAAEVGLPADEIARANNLTKASVHAGQRLVLPSTPIYFDRHPLTADAPTVIAAGRAIAPLRAVIEQAGGQVKWDAAARRASARARGHEIAVTIGSDQAQVDGGLVTMAAAAELRCDRTVVPLRFLGDALDLVLQYEGGVIHLASAR